jgi:hypothetical protein
MRLLTMPAFSTVRRNLGRNTAKFISECVSSNRRPLLTNNTFRMMSTSQLSVPKKLDDIAKLGVHRFFSIKNMAALPFCYNTPQAFSFRVVSIMLHCNRHPFRSQADFTIWALQSFSRKSFQGASFMFGWSTTRCAHVQLCMFQLRHMSYWQRFSLILTQCNRDLGFTISKISIVV